MLENFQAIKIEEPSTIIIRQIRNHIASGNFKPGDKLPPERKLAEAFGVSRHIVRDAIQKLEIYGVLKTLPQSGTVISGIGIIALEGIISDVLTMEETDFESLVETRVLLELKTAEKAALQRTTDNIKSLKSALEAHEAKVVSGLSAVEEDLLFHIQIAEASGNKVLKCLMTIITPDIIKHFTKLNVCDDTRALKTIKEHKDILDCIIAKDTIGARKAMEHHLFDISNFSKNK